MTNVTVTSVIQLSTEQTSKIKKAVEKKYGPDVTYSFKIDPTILGGVIVVVNSRKLDGSIKARLEEARQELTQRIMSE